MPHTDREEENSTGFPNCVMPGDSRTQQSLTSTFTLLSARLAESFQGLGTLNSTFSKHQVRIAFLGNTAISIFHFQNLVIPLMSFRAAQKNLTLKRKKKPSKGGPSSPRGAHRGEAGSVQPASLLSC